MKTPSRNSKTIIPQAKPRTDWISIADDYAKDAVADKKGDSFCKWVRLAAQRYLTDKKDAQKKGALFYLCPTWADKVCTFAEMMPHVEGEWDTPTIVLEPWQIFFLVNIFGWRRVRDGKRRFSEIYLEVARKNAKSAISSIIGLFCLCCEGEPGPQVKCAATTGDQARIVFGVQQKMIEKTPALKKQFKLEVYANIIACLSNGGNIKPINAKASTQDGLNPHCNILDELHAHKTRDLYDVLHSAQGARKNPMNLVITTAGFDTTGVCYEQHRYVRQILEGVLRADHYFGIIYTLDDGDDAGDSSKWIKANPNYGVSVIEEKIMQDYIDARHSPEKMAEFKTKRLNIWLAAKNGYINTIIWQRGSSKPDLEALESVPCYGAFDLASVSDLTAWRLVWKVEDRVKTWGKFYLPEDAIAPRTEKNGIPYRTWVEMGLITVTPGNVTDYNFIKKDILLAHRRFNLKKVAYDVWNASHIANELAAEGIELEEFVQGTRSFNPPMREIERLYLSERLDHGADPVLTWNASNIVARRDENDNLAPDKKKSFEKIDGFVALAMALGIMLRDTTEAEGASVYESRGIIEIEV